MVDTGDMGAEGINSRNELPGCAVRAVHLPRSIGQVFIQNESPTPRLQSNAVGIENSLKMLKQ